MNPAIIHTLNDTSGAAGLEHVILQLQLRLSMLPWLKVIYGRAFTVSKLKETEAEPAVYTGQNEYRSVLPNDFVESQSFFRTEGPERYGDALLSTGGYLANRDLSLIVWVNLHELDHPSRRDDIYLETLKYEVEEQLRACEFVMKIDEYYDDHAADIFRGYDLEPIKPERLKFPYCGFRISLTVYYQKPC
ncbi:hypothetical protein BWI97_15720 [Siphonobacter sp. BAB-5405]|uniref:hypothetical protein n=1 Tax=Siphonobacter sp. BAB-5405 TaxID=1864825 RepID=UPI000C7FFFA7|nr:hypothetical protein [Siphonobacter sp. BAB-5405]PMD94844.1 hypothetical protein BWI97_15720 [Siphonobacter sp. BAB-5405]